MTFAYGSKIVSRAAKTIPCLRLLRLDQYACFLGAGYGLILQCEVYDIVYEVNEWVYNLTV
jgi:hypothetical protein